MPATERSFTADLPPLHLYLDSDFLLNILQPSDPYHARCVSFAERLIQHGMTRLYLSTTSWAEIIHVATQTRFRQRLPATHQRQFRLDRWEEPDVRAAYLQMVIGTIEDLLAPFDWHEISVTPGIFRAAVQLLATYNLGCQDAIHLACMRHVGIADLVSFDEGFRRVDGMYLWNDLIHLPRT